MSQCGKFVWGCASGGHTPVQGAPWMQMRWRGAWWHANGMLITPRMEGGSMQPAYVLSAAWQLPSQLQCRCHGRYEVVAPCSFISVCMRPYTTPYLCGSTYYRQCLGSYSNIKDPHGPASLYCGNHGDCRSSCGIPNWHDPLIKLRMQLPTMLQT
eukprot:365059-Chlamydomonas_euryale.AAC.3